MGVSYSIDISLLRSEEERRHTIARCHSAGVGKIDMSLRRSEEERRLRLVGSAHPTTVRTLLATGHWSLATGHWPLHLFETRGLGGSFSVSVAKYMSGARGLPPRPEKGKKTLDKFPESLYYMPKLWS